MTYTAENIANIKRAGNLEAYIAAERETLAKIDGIAAVEVEGEQMIQLGYLYGRFGGEIGGENGDVVFASISTGSDWAKSWNLKSFAGEKAAIAYAKAALKNELERMASKIISEKRARIASLEAAK